MKAKLKKAGESSKALGDLDDQLRGRIEEIEQALRQHLSVRVETTFDDSIGCPKLVFCKQDKEWRLVVWTASSGDVPLAKVSRTQRSVVFRDKLVEKLLRDAVGQIDAMIEERKKALEAADYILAALREATP